MTDEIDRICRYCCEPVRPKACKCPHCRQWLGRWLGNPYLPLFLVLILIGYMFFWIDHATDRGSKESFSRHRDKVVVTESRVHFSEPEDNANGSTVGKIRNDSDFAWEDIYLEVQYFDDKGTLIDTEGAQQYGLTLTPQSEAAFRLRTQADKAKSAVLVL